MIDSHTAILLKEYEIVNEHWIYATKHKATVVQITGGLVVSLAATAFLGHVSWPIVALIVPVVILVAAFPYAQKEADFWVAAMCLESIERAVNHIEKAELLTFAHKYRNCLFRRRHDGALSLIWIMQQVRVLPGVALLGVCYYVVLREYGWFVFAVHCALFVLTVFCLAASKRWTVRLMKKQQNELVHATRYSSMGGG